MELLSSALLLRCIYFQVAMLSEAKFGRERPPYLLSKHWKCNPGEVGEGEVSRSQGAGTDQQPSITTLELNALRYAAGYIPRALLKKLKKSAHPLNDELQLCLLDLLDDGDEEGGTAEEWLNLIDRGSLKRVNESTFQVMVAMELELRKHLQPQEPPNFVRDITEHILENEDVQFHWCLVGCDWRKRRLKHY